MTTTFVITAVDGGLLRDVFTHKDFEGAQRIMQRIIDDYEAHPDDDDAMVSIWDTPADHGEPAVVVASWTRYA